MTREHYNDLLRQLDEQTCALGDLVVQTIRECVITLDALDAGRAQALIDADTRIDELRHAIESQVVLLLATQQPMAGDLRLLVSMLSISTELERIGDYCEGNAKLVLRMAAEPVNGSLNDIRTMAQVTEELLLQTLQAFRLRDVELAGEVWLRDDEVDALYQQVFRRVLLEMVTDRATVRVGTYLLWVAHNFERMADRVTNIAEQVAFAVTGDVGVFRERLRSQSVPT